jgi:hypothetical protein
VTANLQRWLFAVLALWAPGCRDGPDPEATNRVLLLGGNLFAGGDRCVQLLDEMASASGVLGPVCFDLVAVPGASPDELAQALRTAPAARAVVVVIGDLSLLTGINTNADFPPSKLITSRLFDREALDETLETLRSIARSRGMLYVLATHPLGLQGRIEVPELSEVADAVRAGGATLDLAKTFSVYDQQLLFTNGIDELDEYGHDAFANALFYSLLDDQAPIPARDDAEAAARAECAALLSWARGDDARFRPAARAILLEPPAGVAQATRHAAIANLLQGIAKPTRHRWTLIDPASAGDVPGLAVGRLLTLGKPGPIPADPVERAFIEILSAISQRDDNVLALADKLVAAEPHRATSWIALGLAASLTRDRQGVPQQARKHLQTYSSGNISPARWEQLMTTWPSSLAALPAMLQLDSIFRSHLPAGPALHAARRSSRLGLHSKAGALLDRATKKLEVPRNWTTERKRLAKLAEG